MSPKEIGGKKRHNGLCPFCFEKTGCNKIGMYDVAELAKLAREHLSLRSRVARVRSVVPLNVTAPRATCAKA